VSTELVVVDGLGKRFDMAAPRINGALRDVIAGLFARLAGKKPDLDARSVWALRDVSFRATAGEVIGLVGGNGAGKSTLLKLLARITVPSEGQAVVSGRLGSLLEVGTGFHPDLTGRENIYLSGAFLGMRRQEVRRRFDEIVEFAGIGKFLDEPVKRYSSGMYVRLAFSVGIHLETEVLVVDEILAVGDAEFQRRCFDKVRSLRGTGGRTIFMVTHNLAALRQMCHRGLLLSHGKLLADGPIDQIIDRYLAQLARGASEDAVSTTSFDVLSATVTARSGPDDVIKTFDPVCMKVRVRARVPISEPGIKLTVLGADRIPLCAIDSRDFLKIGPVDSGGTFELSADIESLPLLPGGYQLRLALNGGESALDEDAPGSFAFDVVESAVYGGRFIDSSFGVFGLRSKVAVHQETS